VGVRHRRSRSRFRLVGKADLVVGSDRGAQAGGRVGSSGEGMLYLVGAHAPTKI
jgi:hypothetical protein